ncbi:hypothetical protein HJG60_011410 [Phyllostomus discolor]|uniref:Uncharacterized protein n=1 Tax=Phyllostomus discolor TaxID=89673 RepID=A0A834A7X2_9CHIR|nr:hypothetical protein HJG60_011410 [Phyllostomus discolor]
MFIVKISNTTSPKYYVGLYEIVSYFTIFNYKHSNLTPFNLGIQQGELPVVPGFWREPLAPGVHSSALELCPGTFTVSGVITTTMEHGSFCSLLSKCPVELGKREHWLCCFPSLEPVPSPVKMELTILRRPLFVASPRQIHHHVCFLCENGSGSCKRCSFARRHSGKSRQQRAREHFCWGGGLLPGFDRILRPQQPQRPAPPAGGSFSSSRLLGRRCPGPTPTRE